MKSTITVFILLVVITACVPQQRSNYILDETELVPEGIDYSESTGLFYLTSVAKSKIIKVDPKNGKQENFIDENEYDFMPGVGIFADDQHNRLLALAGYFHRHETQTTLFIFDLKTGELLQKIAVQDSGRHFLNDLVVTPKGDVYITDTSGSAVYRLEKGNGELRIWLHSAEIQYPNGIALSDDNQKLYVASHTKGIRIIDIKTKEILNDADSTFHTKGIDGLEFFKGNLYAVQNGVNANGDNFRKIELNAEGDEIIGIKIIDANSQNLEVPLTFCIVKNKAVVIGNSNLHLLNQQDYTFTQPDSLKNTNLLVYELK